ncbi:type III secretion system export apparatus subunit SctS [Serratia quinivorans]|uniref:type III secretion system export apparatus subunit SctS n=1 Tax=Serratia quinivorans TaxID=137545 RepID=UPI002178267E|nr:type III secretion system export apparatus subunit SctS [Serratia quinivorans]CAI1008407.1 Flagellar biosynthetic protein FliQ [Serratia quinivorans]CAI1808957.1 Flagellar biosynthetic protein FliQ [Serratia quinivorans]
MNNAMMIHLTVELLWLVLSLSLPTVVVASLVGVLVSLLQTLTQLQDQTLQFLLKLVAVCITLALSYRWTGDNLYNYTQLVFDQIGNMRGG